MRFYNNKQAGMLRNVSLFLQKEHDNLVKKVPALKKFIAEFIEMEARLYAVVTGNLYVVKKSTLEKQSVREAFIKQIARLIAVLKAAGYTFKNKPLPEMRYTLAGLKRLSATDLCKTYENVYKAAKKIKNLQYYGLKGDDMKDLQAYYKEFADIKNAPLIKKKEKASQQKLLIKGVKDCILFLQNHIDPLLFIATEDDWQMQMKYNATRQVLPRAQGRPSDAESGYRKSRDKKKKEPGIN